MNTIIELYCKKIDQHVTLPLTNAEQIQAETIKSNKRRREWVAGRWLRRFILSQKLACEPTSLLFSQTSSGKPYLTFPSTCYFNLSHCHQWCCLAICSTHPVGVDVEQTNSSHAILDIARHYFTEAEYQSLLQLPTNQQYPLFYTMWSAKEAALKMTGKGLAGGLNSIHFSFDPHHNTLSLASSFGSNISINNFQIDNDTIMTLAAPLLKQDYSINTYIVHDSDIIAKPLTAAANPICTESP